MLKTAMVLVFLFGAFLAPTKAEKNPNNGNNANSTQRAGGKEDDCINKGEGCSMLAVAPKSSQSNSKSNEKEQPQESGE